MTDDYETCERCEHYRLPDDMETIELLDEYYLCDGCVRALSEDVQYYDWRDRYTEEQHERAIELLTERDEFECVISSYEEGQIIVHTPYVSSDVITDFCNHFGFDIIAFGPQWKENEMWPCVRDHGSTFEIILEYNSSCPQPVPTNATFNEMHIERLSENDKQF